MAGIVLTGMHHSGTSLSTGLLTSAGWHPGDDLIPDDPSNGKRFYEDSALVALSRQWFAVSLPTGEGHPDWGISNRSGPDLERINSGRDSARAYCRSRQSQQRPWIAKDPRVALTLPLWRDIPETRFILIYRSPWDVVASVTRVGNPFCGRPQWIRDAWLLHNRMIAEHKARDPEASLLVSAERVVEDPEGFVRLVANWTGEKELHRERGNLSGVVDSRLFTVRGDGSSIAALYRELYPEVYSTLEALDNLADLPRHRGSSWESVVAPGGSLRANSGVQVVTPCRDDGQFLDEAVASVESAAHDQRFGVELTVVDDGSSDLETSRILSRLGEIGYQVKRTEARGLSAARNVGVAASNSAAVLPLDADNRISRELMTQALLVLRGEKDIVHGPWQRFGLDAELIEPPAVSSWASFYPFNTVDACAVISRRLFRSIGGYDESLPYLEDWEFWMRAFRSGATFHRIDSLTFHYLVRPDSLLSTTSTRYRESARVYRQLLDRFEPALRSVGIEASTWSDIATHLERQASQEP